MNSEDINRFGKITKVPITTENLTGRTFARLSVLRYLGCKNRSAYWECQCECGTTKGVHSNRLRTGATRSCGCLRRETLGIIKVKHGHNRKCHITREYTLWQSMKRRCLNKNSSDYSEYGGRGITIYEPWLEFSVFYSGLIAEIGKHPGLGYSIDRIDNNEGYKPGNIRWATSSEQAYNRRPARRRKLK